jgi:phosphatidylethanolamine-binding protein (PEBP) family uncharacterized protein
MNVWRRSRSPRLGAAISSSVVLVLALAFAGCGTSGGAATAGSRQPQIAFTSPSMNVGQTQGGGLTIPVRYTCDGADTTPSFRWGAVPPNTAQLALFLFRLGRSTPTGNGNVRVEIKLEWALAGLSPKLHEIRAGKLPRGAVSARKPYSICPPKGKAASYLFQLNALSRPLAVGSHFDANKLLQAVEAPTVGSGTFTSSYKRS